MRGVPDVSRRAGPAGASTGVREGEPFPPASGTEAPASDLQSVLAAALRRLVDEAGVERAAVWMGAGEGPPRVIAAVLGGTATSAPTRATYAAVAALPGAADLGTDSLHPELAHARELGYSAAVPLARGENEAAALLLVGGTSDPAGAVRPRVLAALEAAARRLEVAVAADCAATRLARLDEGVRRLDRLAGLGDLVAEIVHEVRNPLVSVKTFLQLLPERLGDAEFRRSFLEVVTGELARIERLLDVLLQHARPRTPTPAEGSPAAVSEAIETVARLLAHRAAVGSVRLIPDVEPNLPCVALGADALRQVVLNLAINALEQTPPGGDVQLGARRTKGTVELAVADRGPGVPEALRHRVFEPFFSTHGDRAGGLGLAISRRIVEEAGGRVAVGDRPGGGAVFHVRLPAA